MPGAERDGKGNLRKMSVEDVAVTQQHAETKGQQHAEQKDSKKQNKRAPQKTCSALRITGSLLLIISK